MVVRDLGQEFADFWAAYPRHTAKLAAQKAYAKAREHASAEEILAGVERYKQHKPAYADWCYPATFLNQGRWMDEGDTMPATREERPITVPERERAIWLRRSIGGCPHTPKCRNSAACVGEIVRRWRRAEQGK